MNFLKCHYEGKPNYINFDTVAFISDREKDAGCCVSFVTSDSEGDQVFCLVDETVEEILSRLPLEGRHG